LAGDLHSQIDIKCAGIGLRGRRQVNVQPLWALGGTNQTSMGELVSNLLFIVGRFIDSAIPMEFNVLYHA
jgi:hypothetical protein